MFTQTIQFNTSTKIILNIKDEESEPLTTNNDSYTSINNNSSSSSSSWKKWGMGGAALTALLCVGYTTLHNSSSSPTSPWYDTNNNDVAPNAVDLLSHHHHHADHQDIASSHSTKKSKGEKKHVLTKAEMNTKLFDDQRKLLLLCFILGRACVCVVRYVNCTLLNTQHVHCFVCSICFLTCPVPPLFTHHTLIHSPPHTNKHTPTHTHQQTHYTFNINRSVHPPRLRFTIPRIQLSTRRGGRIRQTRMVLLRQSWSMHCLLRPHLQRLSIIGIFISEQGISINTVYWFPYVCTGYTFWY